MRDTAYDNFGTPIKVGDRLAMAVPAGNSAEQRIGTLIGFREGKSKQWLPHPTENRHIQTDVIIDKMEIEWDKELSQGGAPDKPTLMVYNDWAERRMIKLPVTNA